MSRTFPRRTLLSLLPAAFVISSLLAGCEQPAPMTTGETVPYDPEKSKSQEDSMKKAMIESQKAARNPAKKQ